MLDHISVAVSDLQRSIAFYDAVFRPLRISRLWTATDAAGYGSEGSDEPFAIKRSDGGEPVAHNSRTHVAFRASSRDAAASFHAHALEFGGTSDGAPGLHPEYGPGYFAAFVRDPDGHKLEAVVHETAPRPVYAFDHVQLAMPAGQESLARRFYAEVLGFEEIPKPEELAARGGAWFRSGPVNIHVGVDRGFMPAKKAHPALRAANYERLLERLRECGVTVTPDPLPFAGAAHCYIEDPFGNRVELIAVQ
ncbi:MAG TPA: VOC family protein [Candidatus Elarobacter sp.]|nr:VOC family protein [Candidatus Elarobacter sp.]